MGGVNNVKYMIHYISTNKYFSFSFVLNNSKLGVIQTNDIGSRDTSSAVAKGLNAHSSVGLIFTQTIAFDEAQRCLRGLIY